MLQTAEPPYGVSDGPIKINSENGDYSDRRIFKTSNALLLYFTGI